jgi:hypothetical protein
MKHFITTTLGLTLAIGAYATLGGCNGGTDQGASNVPTPPGATTGGGAIEGQPERRRAPGPATLDPPTPDR